ncbi:T9SS type B sorting domain-containing protein [Hymenobacter jejuensis]|uniref:Gliding motility-associated C-terminal domain-containing protein n=1 Tax=Hymenobacter jejuensis TaxID=2502781 RepID=A0A5B8A482_9BACT|nr:gliding motility-associated C-terminal domain-containing protein [Hymenobacter jejuensis]QDA61415.1 gliding motility-associated C-terminal domain-containing protein [Hymenobacter jejuensis]
MQPHLLRIFFILVTILGLGARPAAATHLLGGEMGYQYLDDKGPVGQPFRYRITVFVYFNADVTSNFPNGRDVIPIGLYSKSPNGTRIGVYSFPRVSNALIKPATSGDCAAGSTNSPVPVRLCKYELIVNLPVSAAGYYAFYTESARNNDIRNLSNPGGTGLTLYTDISPPLIPNSTPTFSDTAVAVICQGDTSIIINNAYDADGDRLVYSFGTPYGGNLGNTPPSFFNPPPTSVVYASTYNVAQPFGPGRGSYAFLDPQTGLSRYAAPFLGKYVVAVDVKEYRVINGQEVLVGTTRRDIQLIAQTCQPNQAPQFTASTTAIKEFTIEEGQSLSFDLAARDPELKTLSLRVNSVLLDGPGGFDATFANDVGTVSNGSGSALISGTGNVSGTFRFNSRCGNARATPYDVVVTAADQACGSKSVAQIIRITVKRASPPTAITGDALVCDQSKPSTYTVTGTNASSYLWRVRGGAIQGPATGSSVSVLWNTAGTGTLSARGITAFGCTTDSVARTVEVRPVSTLSVSADVAICVGTSATLTASGGQNYTWTGGGQTFTGASITVTPNTTTIYTVTSTDGLCSNSRQVTVTVRPQTAADVITGSRSVCPTVQGVTYSVVNPQNTDYQWTVQGGNIVSGQGTTSITVAWGATNANASVQVVGRNAFGCLTAPFVLPVRINELLATPKPNGPLRVCQTDGPFTYQTQLTNGSSYAWQVIGGTQVATNQASIQVNWTRPGIGKLVVTETSNPNGSDIRCLGQSDTLYVTVLPSPAANLAITGPDRVCANSGPVSFTLPGLATSTYQFTLQNAAQQNVAFTAAGNTASVATFATPGVYTLTARETSASACAGPVYTKTFTVDPLPVVTITGPANVCPEGLNGLRYSVPGATGAAFQWTVTDGTIVSGQGTSAITVNFLASNITKTVTVVPTSSFGCTGALASFSVKPDNAAITLNVATVDPQNDHQVLLSVPNLGDNGSRTRVLRRDAGSTGAFAVVPTILTGTRFADASADADAKAYTYRVELTNACGTVIASQEHTIIHTEAVATEGKGGRSEGEVSIQWSDYKGFAVKQYQVFRHIDNAKDELVATIPAGQPLQYKLSTGSQGFNQCFRVTAVSDDASALLTYSNDACVTFENKIALYNIITPNGDGKNDVFFIDNVQLYAGNQLAIFNRWGKEVYSTTNYRNTWGGEGLGAGMYYYLFKLPSGTSYKGWFEIVKDN